MAELSVLFRRAVEGFGSRVHSIREEQWHDPTPCTDWDVRMLLNHVAVEQLWVPPLIDGSSVQSIGDRLDGDQLGADPVATWDASASAAVAAFAAAGALDATVSLSGGDMAATRYCWEMTTDALIHTWDLARGIGADERLDAELVELVHERTVPIAGHLQESGMFAPPVAVPHDASPQTKLLGLFGRTA